MLCTLLRCCSRVPTTCARGCGAGGLPGRAAALAAVLTLLARRLNPQDEPVTNGKMGRDLFAQLDPQCPVAGLIARTAWYAVSNIRSINLSEAYSKLDRNLIAWIL